MCLCALGPKKKKYDELSSKQYIDITYLPYLEQLMLCVHINVVKQVQNAIILTQHYTHCASSVCKSTDHIVASTVWLFQPTVALQVALLALAQVLRQLLDQWIIGLLVGPKTFGA